MQELLEQITGELLAKVLIESVDPQEPVKVRAVPKPWKLLGTGNYAAVFYHPEAADYAVKVYAPGRPGLEEEAEVYRRLGRHPAFSECYYTGAGFLILKRLKGVTFYDSMKKGVLITGQAVQDIDYALEYARSRGLHPHDVHAKNVMIQNGRGLIVDISDFLKEEDCSMWEDYKKAYYHLYRPVASRWMFPVPGMILEAVRKGYRLWRRRKQ
ncbi:serine/threonine-protein kinase [Paenibacillus sp. MMS20-IR301]|uniref:serine/threonine-protein kinase n=1 Tax=Paenibacillus sp. MMS20-IR301 TaxID=2895946 RepID=UPI0028E1CA01|nr:serine/threonine-protein kinase [Paenibacillus sp. MMS20-IR301]WNS46967.1 serine/threonine-protein kinase [Paenibacillus sp. MMS20-IR301]